MDIIFSHRCLEYQRIGHPEGPARVRIAHEYLTGKGFTSLEPAPAGREELLAVHALELVRRNMARIYQVFTEIPTILKGLINDPHMNGSCDMNEGLHRARKILLKITDMGLPTATEVLDPITPQYLAGLVCWAAIGAR
ncbi:TPA: hypothetical protein EYP84_00655, partial [Candidatus Bipolaricaulota bacterium]|nr:hypothetical protein [Candidatus Bipolaricaulota bacterium]